MVPSVTLFSRVNCLLQHVKWLKELQEERRQLEEKKDAEQKQQLERKRLFMEREAKKRAAAKVNNDSNSCTHHDEHPIQPLTDDSSTVASSIASTVSANKRKKKPAWCQSETDHEATDMDDEADLLEFANGLDFDEYSQDLELQSLMGQVKERIKKLERENKKDETKLQTCLDVSAIVPLFVLIKISRDVYVICVPILIIHLRVKTP